MLILRRRTTTCDSSTVQIVQSHQVASFESDPRPPRIGVCVSFAEESCARKIPFPKHGGFIEDRQFFSELHRRQNCQKVCMWVEIISKRLAGDHSRTYAAQLPPDVSRARLRFQHTGPTPSAGVLEGAYGSLPNRSVYMCLVDLEKTFDRVQSRL